MDYLSQIPKEIVLEIAYKLDVNSVLSLSDVARKFRFLTTYKVMKEITRKIYPRNMGGTSALTMLHLYGAPFETYEEEIELEYNKINYPRMSDSSIIISDSKYEVVRNTCMGQNKKIYYKDKYCGYISVGYGLNLTLIPPDDLTKKSKTNKEKVTMIHHIFLNELRTIIGENCKTKEDIFISGNLKMVDTHSYTE